VPLSYPNSVRLAIQGPDVSFVAPGARPNLLGESGRSFGGDRRLDLRGHLSGALRNAWVLAASGRALAVIGGEPGAGFSQCRPDARGRGFAILETPLAIHDVEPDLLERRRQLFFHTDEGGVADKKPVALLDAPMGGVEADGGVEFQSVPPGVGPATRTSTRS